METFEKKDHVLRDLRRYAGEREKLEDWKAAGRELEKTHPNTYVRKAIYMWKADFCE